MTNIELTKDKQGNIVKFIMNGHTQYVESDDIVCAALSAVSYSTLNGIENILGVNFGYEVKDGYLHFELPAEMGEDTREKVNILLDTLYLFVTDLQKQHENHIKINLKHIDK